MYKLVKYVGMGLLVFGLAACDNSDSTAAGDAAQSSAASGQPISLLDGKLSFSLPAGMSDMSDKLTNPSSNVRAYADNVKQKAVIVIINDDDALALDKLAADVEQKQRARDPQLQVIASKDIEIKGHTLRQFDSVISENGKTTWSSILFTRIGDKQATLQISLPADNQQQAQTEAQNIINTIVIQ
ncbi:DcrB family lipoprotein [Entomohabitans teleogrylli]|uniref:DcrB family lipoprotein n=1 Tax=Entomohabitans teleogrylli TaxID=1384589 RepID=UPI00073D56EA|nr:DcrB family lipoprotein [Entomohabitans teleogrylli]